MILRDCKKGMVFLPPNKTRLPVKVVTEEERIILYFKTYRLQDCRQLMQVDFYDLSQGLPAEIAARKKQYEYYREKLLTFPRKGTSARGAR